MGFQPRPEKGERGFAVRMSRERVFWGEGNCQCKGPEAGSRSRSSWGLEWSEGGKLVVGSRGGQSCQRQVTHPLVGHGEDSGCFSE